MALKPVAAAFALLLLSSACSNGASERCREMCRRESDCAEELSKNENSKYDRDECVSACMALERDSYTKSRVDEHQACSEKAKSCKELMDCR